MQNVLLVPVFKFCTHRVLGFSNRYVYKPARGICPGPEPTHVGRPFVDQQCAVDICSALASIQTVARKLATGRSSERRALLARRQTAGRSAAAVMHSLTKLKLKCHVLLVNWT